jgi:gluconolactonase
MHPLTVYRQELKNYIHADFELQILDDDCLFAEGPVWSKEGFYLFSDIPGNTINKIIPGAVKEVYIHKSGCTKEAEAELPRMMGSNGLAFDAEQNLIICQHGNHSIALYNGQTLAPLITAFNGKRLNSPNDVVADNKGKIFFSDPPYGLKDQVLNAAKYQPAAGLYCWNKDDLKMFWNEYQYPNGVCLSPDHTSLFTCSNKPFEAAVLEFDAETLLLKRLVCKETSDGIKCDKHQQLYLCNKDGIIIINQKGERMGLIQLPAIPSNICWGGKEGNDLLITARENIFFIQGLQK